MRTCVHCWVGKPDSEFGRDKKREDGINRRCKACNNADTRRLYRQREAVGLCHCGRKRKKGGKTCSTCRGKFIQWRYRNLPSVKNKQRSSRQDIKRRILEHYGCKCMCECGCTTKTPLKLTVDHINGGGNAHRRAIKKYGHNFYVWMIKNNFPPGFRLLCFDCNCSRKNNFGVCPDFQPASAPPLVDSNQAS